MPGLVLAETNCVRSNYRRISDLNDRIISFTMPGSALAVINGFKFLNVDVVDVVAAIVQVDRRQGESRGRATSVSRCC